MIRAPVMKHPVSLRGLAALCLASALLGNAGCTSGPGSSSSGDAGDAGPPPSPRKSGTVGISTVSAIFVVTQALAFFSRDASSTTEFGPCVWSGTDAAVGPITDAGTLLPRASAGTITFGGLTSPLEMTPDETNTYS